MTRNNFLNIHDIKYESETMTPVGYCQKIRSPILINTAQKREVIYYNSKQPQVNNEVIGSVFEDFIQYSVIQLIDPRLVKHVQNHY